MPLKAYITLFWMLIFLNCHIFQTFCRPRNMYQGERKSKKMSIKNK